MKKGALKDMKKEVEKNIAKAQVIAEKELKKLRQTVESSLKKTEAFVKKNPEKAALIAAGVGAALGAAVTKILTSRKK